MSNPLLDLISRGESGSVGYDAYNRGMYRDMDGVQHFRGQDRAIDLSGLTVGQVLDLQHADPAAPDRLFAVGKYQVIPSTMNDAVNKLGLNRNERFTPELQDRIFSHYLIVDKQHAVQDFITSKSGASVEAAQRALAREWASFGDPDKGGETHYKLPNHASIALEQSATALSQMRADYKVSIEKGLTPDAAWQAVTDSGSSQAQTQSAPHRAAADGVPKRHLYSEAVSVLQADLGALGYTDNHGRPLGADGHFGPATRAVVEGFQHDQGISADGKIGPITRQHLDAAMRDKQIADVVSETSCPGPLDQLRAFSALSHPQNAMYCALKDMLPQGTSEDRLAQSAAACHKAGITDPKDLSGVYVGDLSVVFTANSLHTVPALIDISQPAPSVQQSVQHIQQYDQQQAQMMGQIHAQNAQINHQGAMQGGPGPMR